MKISDSMIFKTIEVAQIASDMIFSRFNDAHKVEKKGTVDLVTEVDLASEKLISEELRKRFPHIPFHGEEGGGNDWRSGEIWIVDPIDGTTNFANRLTHFGVSIALCRDGEPVLGVVINPMTKELFHCSLGGGAFLNNNPIRVSSVNDLNDALAATGFPYNRRENMQIIIDRLRAFLMRVADVRRFGSASLDLCYLAKGVYSIFWEQNLKPWDIAAGTLLVNEAGGKITKMNGEKMLLDSYEILATNSILHQECIDLLASCNESKN